MKTRKIQKLHLRRETLSSLTTDELSKVRGATLMNTECGYNCSVVLTCPHTVCGPP